MKGISVITPTARVNPRFQEMADALAVVIERTGIHTIEWIIVDAQLWYIPNRRDQLVKAVQGRFAFSHVEPKPCRWQGPHRLTRQDYWAKANALNTGFVYANFDHVACFDDCTVVTEDWLRCHMAAAEARIAAAGPYPYLQLGALVEAGRVLQSNVAIEDHRLRTKPDEGPCDGSWLYGGNFSVPLDVVLRCDGLDEIMDGSSGLEDCEFGIRVSRTIPCRWYPQALAYQLIETHDSIYGGGTPLTHGQNVTPPYKGFEYKDPSGIQHSMSWNFAPIWRLLGERFEQDVDGFWCRIVEPAYAADRTRIQALGNHFSIEEQRAHRLKGLPLSTPPGPAHDWRDGQLLAEMKSMRREDE